MCIRDSENAPHERPSVGPTAQATRRVQNERPAVFHAVARPCLLYTSDAADERSSVDLGGRRIIKKKT